MKMSSLSFSAAIVSVPIHRSPLSHRRPALRCGPRAGVSKYLAEAASQIFSPMTDDVPWVAESFTGKIKHHEEVSRLHRLADEVKAAREHLEATIGEASDDETPSTSAAPPASVPRDYVTSSISRIFDNKATSEANEPATFFASAGYRARGRTQRDVRREINRLGRFERVVKRAIETAEVKDD